MSRLAASLTCAFVLLTFSTMSAISDEAVSRELSLFASQAGATVEEQDEEVISRELSLFASQAGGTARNQNKEVASRELSLFASQAGATAEDQDNEAVSRELSIFMDQTGATADHPYKEIISREVILGAGCGNRSDQVFLKMNGYAAATSWDGYRSVEWVWLNYRVFYSIDTNIRM